MDYATAGSRKPKPGSSPSRDASGSTYSVRKCNHGNEESFDRSTYGIPAVVQPPQGIPPTRFPRRRRRAWLRFGAVGACQVRYVSLRVRGVRRTIGGSLSQPTFHNYRLSVRGYIGASGFRSFANVIFAAWSSAVSSWIDSEALTTRRRLLNSVRTPDERMNVGSRTCPMTAVEWMGAIPYSTSPLRSCLPYRAYHSFHGWKMVARQKSV